MLLKIRHQLKGCVARALTPAFPDPGVMPSVQIEEPAVPEHGDLASNIAMKSARVLRRAPIQIAQDFCGRIKDALANDPLGEWIEDVRVAPPGFINFIFSPSAGHHIVETVLLEREAFGRSASGEGQSVQLEFVSANPTGPLSVAHARQAAVGDALANILEFCGYAAVREYYVNDGGNQIAILGKSVELRAREILGEIVSFPEECYQGAYISDMARIFLENQGIRDIASLDQLENKDNRLKTFGAEYLLDVIRSELEDFGVHFDSWSYESRVADDEAIRSVLNGLDQKDLLYEKDGALWFRSTDFGDDKDRVVRKSDGTYTYLTPDIAYHKNKYERGFVKVYNIWGPDHHGYIPRIKAAVQALGHDPESLQVLIVQLATIYRNGQPVSMSTRKGEFISLREVLTEVGRDAARFFFLMRGISAHLDFDLDLAKKETPENPVFYIQYAHARIHSILAKAAEEGLAYKADGLQCLNQPEEQALMKKIGVLDLIVDVCRQQMDVFPLVAYLQELATAFHRFYDRHRVVDAAQPDLSAERLALIEAARTVLANGLRLLGVSAPEKM
ncbi:MAG: arginine--tRNA ligase [Candidatus Omnitrophota bacterium]